MKQSTIRKRERQLLVLLKKAIEHTDDAVMITEANVEYPGSKIIYVNPALCVLTGYSEKELIGKSPHLLHGPKTDNYMITGVKNTLSKGESYHGEILDYRKDGSEMNMELDIAPIWGEHNKITNYISIKRDISFQKRKEQEKEELVASISYQLKTPLSTVRGYLELLDKKYTDIKAQKYVENAERETEKILTLINKLLASTKQSSKLMVMKVNYYDMDTIIKQTIKNVKNITGKKIARRGKVNKSILCDADRIGQVLENLLTHVIKFVPKESSVVVRLTQDRKKITISIEGGKAISSAEREDIFQPFYQTKDSQAAINSGLGLYLASEIIKAHGGVIDVADVIGKGSVFYFTLPIESKFKAEQPIQHDFQPYIANDGNMNYQIV